MLNAIFDTLSTAGQSFITFMTTLLNNVVTIFWTAGSGETAGSLTDIGILTLVGVAVAFVFFALRWITRLIKLRG